MPTSAQKDGKVTLADILASMKVVSSAKAAEIKMAEVQTGTSQEDLIRKQNLVAEPVLVQAKAKYFNLPFIDLAQSPLSPEALSLLSRDVAEKYKVFPVSLDKATRTLDLAMADPLDLGTISFLEQKTDYKIRAFWATSAQVSEFISTKYSTSITQEVSEALKEVGEMGAYWANEPSRLGFIKEEKISEIVTHILEFAIRARASDVHIEAQEKSVRVRYRIDGILQEKLTIPRSLLEAVISRIKILSGMKIDEKRVPQDGRFTFSALDENIDLRVSSLPTSWGEKIVMRLLKKTGGVPEITELGLRGTALKNLSESILRPHGIILICGPTGSGKTTTLYSIISRINIPKVNILTLEDPIEYKMPGVNQVQVNPAAGLTFASGLRSFLRQDPNIILVGEIRDRETTDLAIQASLTGHLVFSTLHTNDASGALPRMLDMGAEPYLLASSITAIVAQRVVRKTHDACKKEYQPEKPVLEKIKEVLGSLIPPGALKLYKGEGDTECGNSGYFGRVGIFEVLPVTERISKLIMERASSSDIEKEAVSQGMIRMKQDGLLKALEGITTIEEVLRVAEE